MIGLVVLAVAVLLLRVGLTLYVAGLSRARNAAAAVARVICDFGVAVLAFFLIGAAIVTQRVNPYLGFRGDHFYKMQVTGDVPLFMLQVLIASGILVGAVAERSRLVVVLAGSAAAAGVVVPVLGFWARVGWLSNLGFIDDGGASWLHVAGGAFALVGARVVGPRDGKYHRDGSASMIPGHSIPLAAAGALLMTAGLVAAASTLANAPHTALLAVAAGVVASLAFGQVRYGKPDVPLILTGMMGSAVAISAGCGVVAPVVGILIGGVAGVIVPWAAVELDLRLRVDDPASAAAVHLVGGAWGTLAAGLFCAGRDVGPWARGIAVQTLGLAVAAVVAGGAAVVLFKLLKGRLRASEADEFDGLDLAEHDVGAYPDFQQNSIRSYHLREA